MALAKCENKAAAFYPKDQEKRTFDIPGYPLTTLGSQLLSLAAIEANTESCEALAKHFQELCIQISIGDIVTIEKDIVQVQNLQDLSKETPTEEVGKSQ